jgi:hypothetical protein
MRLSLSTKVPELAPSNAGSHGCMWVALRVLRKSSDLARKAMYHRVVDECPPNKHGSGCPAKLRQASTPLI